MRKVLTTKKGKGEGGAELDVPFPDLMALRADLYPRVYFPDLTTSWSLKGEEEKSEKGGGRRSKGKEGGTNLELMFSEDLVALDFLVGAIVCEEEEAAGQFGVVEQ